jgi:hypothetical protein
VIRLYRQPRMHGGAAALSHLACRTRADWSSIYLKIGYPKRIWSTREEPLSISDVRSRVLLRTLRRRQCLCISVIKTWNHGTDLDCAASCSLSELPRR